MEEETCAFEGSAIWLVGGPCSGPHCNEIFSLLCVTGVVSLGPLSPGLSAVRQISKVSKWLLLKSLGRAGAPVAVCDGSGNSGKD